MKKWILAALMMFSLNIYGEQIDLDEYKISTELNDIFKIIDQSKASILMSKIKTENDDLKKKILSVLLEIELDDLENSINWNIIILENSIENMKKSPEESVSLEIEYVQSIIQQRKEALHIISKWRDKYLNQS